jgi:hypothetical protein
MFTLRPLCAFFKTNIALFSWSNHQMFANFRQQAIHAQKGIG